MRPGRPSGRSVIPTGQVYKRPTVDSKLAIMLRARAKRIDAQFIEKNYSGAAGRTPVGNDRVSNPRPRKGKR